MSETFAVVVNSRQGVVVAVTTDHYGDELEAVILEGVRRWLRTHQPTARGTTSELSILVQA